ncbi:hypothetical protein ABT56_19230 [Photobacterium aquae]|uniref:Uncharacterized protein n=1 Tax=Photobacterium aquae TaxID=1195763 RepID=A0A0J1JMR9_9GAMM|nr:hypothetical protein [Photobacterium aquae]KLV03442.1 hypothetical protein ABT56_19230 [Photobacterium aquae]
MNISEVEVQKVVKALELPEGYSILQLGIGYQYEYAPKGVRYSAPYPELGNKLWLAIQFEMQQVLCAVDESNPQPWVQELIEGNLRDLIVGVMTAITSKYDVTLGICVPAASLIIKNRIGVLCSTELSKPEKSVKDLLQEMKLKFGDKK